MCNCSVAIWPGGKIMGSVCCLASYCNTLHTSHRTWIKLLSLAVDKGLHLPMIISYDGASSPVFTGYSFCGVQPLCFSQKLALELQVCKVFYSWSSCLSLMHFRLHYLSKLVRPKWRTVHQTLLHLIIYTTELRCMKLSSISTGGWQKLNVINSLMLKTCVTMCDNSRQLG